MLPQFAISITRLINHVKSTWLYVPATVSFEQNIVGVLQISIVFQVAIIANSWGNQEMIEAANFLAPVSWQLGLAMVLLDSYCVFQVSVFRTNLRNRKFMHNSRFPCYGPVSVELRLVFELSSI